MAEAPAAGTNWKAMLKDKKLWIGAGVAGVVGLAVFLKRGGSADTGPGSGSAAGTPLAGAGYVAQGGGDTTGANIASWLSSYSQSMQAQQSEYQQHLTDTLTTLIDAKNGGQLTPPNSSLPQTATVVAGWSADRWINDLQGIYKGQNLNLDQAKLQALNPNLNLSNGHFTSTGSIRIQ